MPPKRKVVAKKAVVTEAISNLNVEENGNTQDKLSPFTTRRKVAKNNGVKSLLNSDEKLRMFEDRMANINTKVEMEEMIELPENVITLSDDDEENKKQLKSTNTRPKRVVAEKNVKTAKNPRQRALSEDRQTQIKEKVGVKSRKKQGNVETAVLPSVKVTKKILRSVSVDRLASPKPIAIDVKNKNKRTKTSDESLKKPLKRQALKKEEKLPSKPKRTKKNVLNPEENVPNISPPDKLKVKVTKKKQVFLEKQAVSLDTMQELPKQTGKTKTASKKARPPINKIKKVLKGALKVPKEINKSDEKLEEFTDKNDSNTSDIETAPEVKVIKSVNNIKKPSDYEYKNVEDQLNIESYVISDDDDVMIISEPPVPKTKKLKTSRFKAAKKQIKSDIRDDSDSSDIDDTVPKLKVVKHANNVKKLVVYEHNDVEDQFIESVVISDDDDDDDDDDDVLIISEPDPKTKTKTKKEEKPQRLLQAVAAKKTSVINSKPGHEPKGNMEVVFESDVAALNGRQRLNVPEQTTRAEDDLVVYDSEDDLVVYDSEDGSEENFEAEENNIDSQDPKGNDSEEVLPKQRPEENKVGLELPKRGRKAKVDLKKVLPKDGSPELNDVHEDANVENGDIPDIHLPSTSEVKPTVAKRKTKAKK